MVCPITMDVAWREEGATRPGWVRDTGQVMGNPGMGNGEWGMEWVRNGKERTQITQKQTSPNQQTTQNKNKIHWREREEEFNNGWHMYR